MDTRIGEMERLFKALADGTRLRILGLLLAGEVCVCHIHDSLRIPQSKASRHLAYLRRAGLVAARKDGLWVHYRLAEPRDQVLAAIQQAVHHVLGHAIENQQDVRRLHKVTGCAVPALDAMPGLACCAGGSACGESQPLVSRTPS